MPVGLPSELSGYLIYLISICCKKMMQRKKENIIKGKINIAERVSKK